MHTKKIYKDAPESPGVYLMKNVTGKIIYIGKAANLRRRVSSYFERPHDSRIQNLVGKIKKIAYKKTDTALEALILESELIKEHQPAFNIKEKDDKSFLYVSVTKEKFPRVFLMRGKELAASSAKVFGPFTQSSSLREALRIIRKIFPYNIHPEERVGKFNRPCFDYQLGLCSGTCIGEISQSDYKKIIKNLILFFRGEKEKILKSLEKDMKGASKRLDFEKAAKIRKQIFALRHIQDVALISDEKSEIVGNYVRTGLYRIEGYDISNISGISAVGAMVVFKDGRPDKSQYKKFKIGTISGPNDVGMLREILERRLNHREWPLPDLILIDGGKGQVNAAKEVLDGAGFKMPVVGIAKGAKRKKNEFIGKIPKNINEQILIHVRDEAHRFAISYHKKIRNPIPRF